jgi:hypothetical protein
LDHGAQQTDLQEPDNRLRGHHNERDVDRLKSKRDGRGSQGGGQWLEEIWMVAVGQIKIREVQVAEELREGCPPEGRIEWIL